MTTFGEWEFRKGKVFFDRVKYPTDRQTVESYFDLLVETCNPITLDVADTSDGDYTNIDWASRLTWLDSYGYALTVENVLDFHLKADDGPGSGLPTEGEERLVEWYAVYLESLVVEEAQALLNRKAELEAELQAINEQIEE